MTALSDAPSMESLPKQRIGRDGYSVTELVIAVSIMGILAGIAVGSFHQFLGGGQDALAAERRERLNQALYRFAQQNYDLRFNAMNGSSADEMAVLRTLQYRDPDPARARIGSPYMDPRYNPVTSTDSSTYRLRWNGRLYEMLVPGKPGSGLLMNFEGTDFTTAFEFPPNFQMAGR